MSGGGHWLGGVWVGGLAGSGVADSLEGMRLWREVGVVDIQNFSNCCACEMQERSESYLI